MKKGPVIEIFRANLKTNFPGFTLYWIGELLDIFSRKEITKMYNTEEVISQEVHSLDLDHFFLIILVLFCVFDDIS